MEEQLEPARLAELEDDNKRLRRLLEATNAPRELRHRARNTLAILRTIIRKSAVARSGLEDYISHLEDRLDSIARVQQTADLLGSTLR